MTGSVASYFTGFSGGLVMSMIAFSIVFIVITGLMFLMMGMKSFARMIDSFGKKKSEAPAPAPAVKKDEPVPSSEDEELIAVITAAISASCGTNVRVLSYAPVRKPAHTAWKVSGRMRNLDGFYD